MLTVNVIFAVVCSFLVAGIVRAMNPRAKCTYGAMVITSIAAALIGYAARTNLDLPDFFAPNLGGHTLYVVWILIGAFWGSLMASAFSGGQTDKGSGVR